MRNGILIAAVIVTVVILVFLMRPDSPRDEGEGRQVVVQSNSATQAKNPDGDFSSADQPARARLKDLRDDSVAGPNQASKIDPWERSVQRVMCGGYTLASAVIREQLLNSNELGPEQLSALDAYREKCASWMDGKSPEELFQVEFEAGEHDVALYGKMHLASDSEENIAIARELITSTDAGIALAAATVLIMHDREFQTLVAQSVDSTSFYYTSMSDHHVLFLLKCKVEGDCTSNSFVMLKTCATRPAACGLDAVDWLRRTESDAWVGDIITMTNFVFLAMRGTEPP